MGWAALFMAIAQGISNTISTWSYLKEQKQQANELRQQAQEQADERAKKAKYAMQQQKTSFLKSGVYFDSGSAVDVIDETYTTAMEDIAAINKDSLLSQNRLKRAGKTAFWTYMINPLGNNGSQYVSDIYSGFANAAQQKQTTGNTKMSGGPASVKMTNMYNA